MPITAKAVAAGENKPGEFTYAGEVVHFTYNPAKVTGESIRAGVEADGVGEAASYLALCDTLPTIVTSWDVLERERRPKERAEKVPRVAITPEVFRGLPVAFVNALSAALMEAQRPPEAGSFDGG